MIRTLELRSFEYLNDLTQSIQVGNVQREYDWKMVDEYVCFLFLFCFQFSTNVGKLVSNAKARKSIVNFSFLSFSTPYLFECSKHHAVRFIQENVIQQSCGTLNPLLLTLTNTIKMSSKDLGIKNQDIRLAERFLDTTIRQFHFHLPFVHVNYLLTVDIEIKFT